MNFSIHSIQTYAFVGGGQMAEALIRGLLAGELAMPDSILVAEPDPARREVLQTTYGVRCTDSPEEAARFGRILVLAVKPQLAAEVMAQYRPWMTGQHLVLSIMAGVPLASLAAGLGETMRLIRVMPNTPALVLAGATVFSANALATAEDRTAATTLFSVIGTCDEVPEHLMDAVTGLSGSGPGYVFTFIEALIDGGVLAGLPRSLAERLVVQTVYGSAKMALETGEPAAVLKARVTSPGGTTIAGIRVLEQGGLRGTVMAAVETATHRSRELGA
ncbi:MAG: pyrroline-5-carboxylate reductase [Desulfobulbus sp.]|jgi:pyrroline-5-carboxylate reductase